MPHSDDAVLTCSSQKRHRNQLTFMKLERINTINSVLVVISFCVALLLPYQLLFFSYAFLGPAHYLTQISWLHDKQYFIDTRKILLPLMCATAIAVLFEYRLSAPAIAFSLILSAYYVAHKQANNSLYLIFSAAIIAIALSMIPSAAFFLAALLPTVVHTFIFTGSFLLVGYLKSNDKRAAVTFALFIGLGLSFFFIPHEWLQSGNHFDTLPGDYFDNVANFLSDLTAPVKSIESASNIFAFLSFVYTYHYLNWFSKTGLIRWHEVSKKRGALMVALYFIAISIYLYDYTLGFTVLLSLSLLHVLLEFPLNMKTFATIGKSLQQKLS